MKTAVIVIPTYNESPTIEKLVTSIGEVTSKITGWSFDILVVDSASPDETGKAVERLAKTNKSLHLLSVKKEGLGRAYVEGFAHAIKTFEPDVLFEMDADFSHDPSYIPSFIKKIEDGSDFVIGTRYSKGGSIPKDWGIDRKFFSVLGNLIIRFGFMKLSITDWTSGYRAIKTDFVKNNLSHIQKYTGYVFQVAILDRAVKDHARISETPIEFVDREQGESKINTGQYMRNTLWYVFTNSSFIKYIFVGGIGFILDFGILYFLYRTLGFPIWLGQIISAETAIVSNFLFNNYWSFAHKQIDDGRKGFAKSFLKFNGVALGSLIIQTVSITLFEMYVGHEYVFVFKAIVLIIVIIPYSYILYNRVIWKPPVK